MNTHCVSVFEKNFYFAGIFVYKIEIIEFGKSIKHEPIGDWRL